MAMDDPEGHKIYKRVSRKARRLIEREEVILVTAENHILVNALQRTSTVIIQKSVREGFGLTVTEALWKEKPVVASDVGGISIQIVDGWNRFLLDPKDVKGFASRIIKLLKDQKLARRMGKKEKEFVRRKFLITRLLLNYLNLLNSLTP